MQDDIVTDRRFRSKLGPYESEIKTLSAAGMGTRGIASEIGRVHGVSVSHNAVASFLRTHSKRGKNFMDGVAPGRREELLKALKALWTHDSTAIEGNTLTLGDTIFILQYGLTVKGKPLKDHDDVIAHARGVDLIRKYVANGRLTLTDILELHRTVVVREVLDIYRPVGDWKREENGTYNEVNGRAVYMGYAPVDDTPKLMARWLDDFNKTFTGSLSAEEALEAYLRSHVGFVRIHPFFDGNGRLARLVSNLPVLFSGHPPIVVPLAARAEYIKTLWDYLRAVGTVSLANPDLLPRPELLDPLRSLLRTWWRTTIDLVNEARFSRN